MNSDKIPVIYILGNTRSGSTLLDLLLGSQPQIWTLGEAQDLPWILREKEKPCGCGLPIEQCDFWRELLPKIPVHKGRFPIGYFRDEYFSANKLRGRELRLALFQTLLLEAFIGRNLDKDATAILEYAELNYQYFRVVREAAQERLGREVRWLVDASKNPNRLYWLHRSQMFDLRVIHLERDARGFVNSLTRPDHNRIIILKTARRWAFNNSISLLMHHNYFKKDQLFRLRYKELVTDPETALSRIGEWLGLEFTHDAHHHFREYQNHAISGNSMRWEEKGIYLDEKWRNELPWLDAVMVKMVTWPFGMLLGS